MSLNWKPGDVAAVECSDGKWRRAAYLPVTLDPGVWVFPDNTRRRAEDSSARPLVVIDPDDREQTAALTKVMVAARLHEVIDLHGAVKRALREFANPTPPKLPEPMTWLSVVEDADGLLWFTHRQPDATSWSRAWYCQDLDEYRDYADITAVKVRSEGVAA